MYMGAVSVVPSPRGCVVNPRLGTIPASQHHQLTLALSRHPILHRIALGVGRPVGALPCSSLINSYSSIASTATRPRQGAALRP